MTDQNQKKKADDKAPAAAENKGLLEVRRARDYLIKKELIAKMAKQQAEKVRRARRFFINKELIEVNGKPGNGALILDLSMNGARLRLPFCPPFMSQITLKFSLQNDNRLIFVVGRTIWSRTAPDKGWHDVGVQFYQNYWEIDQLLRLEQR